MREWRAVQMDERFVGAWDLVATERRDAAGTLAGEAFPGYVGQIVYTADGRMSAQLMAPDRPTGLPAERAAWSAEQKARAFDTYISYWGTYTVDARTEVVTHHVRGAVSPALVGTDQPRHFQLAGDRLVLSPPPRADSGERTALTWRRVTAVPAQRPVSAPAPQT
jgi:hypothetical protein